MRIEEANHGVRVVYIPREEYGYISSHTQKFVFVKFEKQLRKRIWDEVTSQACDPKDLAIINEYVPISYE